jgi:hypothetical protein
VIYRVSRKAYTLVANCFNWHQGCQIYVPKSFSRLHGLQNASKIELEGFADDGDGGRRRAMRSNSGRAPPRTSISGGEADGISKYGSTSCLLERGKRRVQADIIVPI